MNGHIQPRSVQTLFLVLLCALSAGVSAATNELGWTLDSALKQLGRQGDDFETLLAQVAVQAQDASGAVVRESAGRIYIDKSGSIRYSVSSPAESVILVTSNEVQEYNPTSATVDVYSLSKHRNRLEPFARLGFTTTGKDLKSDFLVTMLGEDTIRGERALGIELTPKKENVRQTVSKVTLWVNQASWMPMRQVIEHVSRAEVLTLEYTGMARNLNLNKELFQARWPKGTKKVRR